MNVSELSTLCLEMLRLSAPQTDIPSWRRSVLEICDRYHQAQIDHALKTLTDQGYLTTSGSPRTGWLTPAGEQRLAEHAAAVECAEDDDHRLGLSFQEFDRVARRYFWNEILRQTRGNIRRAAMIASLSRTTVHDQLRQLGINAHAFK